MRIPGTVLVILLAQASVVQAGTPLREETLAKFIGEWRMDLTADAETFGERAGRGAGELTCTWGGLQAWVDCELDSQYDGIGHYALKMILYKTRDMSEIGAFVTNSFGGGRLYIGRWQSTNELIFEDAWIDDRKKWDYQRTTYTFAANGQMSYVIEVSNDGSNYLPHSSGVYHRK